jgi:Family of unknown function (DUF6580)
MLRPRFFTVAALIIAAAATRLLPHPLNFAPVTAIALFGGAKFADRRLAFLVPFVAMLLSDLVLGFHATMPFVYGSFALIVCLGLMLRRRQRMLPIAATTISGSALFFVVTNLGFWLMGSDYPKTVAGLTACYVAAIPFFQNTLLGDALYASVLFGTFAIAEALFPVLREQPQEAVSARIDNSL